MGLPEVVIEFKEKQSNFIYRLGRGIVAIPIIDAAAEAAEIVSASDSASIESAVKNVPSTSQAAATKELTSAINAGASKAMVVIAKDVDTMKEALAPLRFNHLALGNLETATQTALNDWASARGYVCGRNFLLYAAQTALDEVKNKQVVAIDDVNLTSEKASISAIAGLLAGVGDESGTYQVIDANTTGAGYATRDQADALVDAGVVTVFYDGEKAKLSRAVTTYYAESSKSAFAKIRNVDSMNMIIDDITDSFENQYIGKVLNSYANKMAFIGLINQSYLAGLSGTVLDPDGANKIDIDVAKHKELAQAAGEDVDSMSEMDLRKYNTGANVYLTGSVRFLDTMEDLTITFSIN